MSNRRDFLIQSALATSVGLFPKKLLSHPALKPHKSGGDISPLIELKDFKGTTEISGDTPDEAHQIFWDKKGFLRDKGGLPSAHETHDVVIVGGGLSGLTSAYHLRDKKVLMLEGNPRLGGNARVEKYKNTYMSLGSAYITIPEEGGLIDTFLKDIGVHHKFKKVEQDRHPVFYKDHSVDSFWKGATDPQKTDDFQRVYEKLTSIYKNSYPDLPLFPGAKIDRQALDQLDRLSLPEWVQKEFGEIHPHIEEYFHQYSWSSFCTSYESVSAAQFLNFFTSDLAGIQALPGGNGMIALGIFNQLKHSGFEVRSNSFVVDIREEEDGVYICYHDQQNQLRAVRAKKCIISSPKIVAKHLIDGMDKEKKDAINDMTYHAYLVANVLFKNHLEPQDYDLYSLKGKVPTSPQRDSHQRVFSDITYAHWANQEQAERSAVTLYIPFPYDNAQQFLFYPFLHRKYSKLIQRALDPFLKNAGKTWEDIEGIRLTRYGHSVAVASTGAIANGTLERAHSPINDKIFFANQDNWANPCFETSFAVGLVAALQATGKDMPV